MICNLLLLALRIYIEQRGTDRQGVASYSYVYDQLSNKDNEARIENTPSHTQGSAKGGHMQLYNAYIMRVVSTIYLQMAGCGMFSLWLYIYYIKYKLALYICMLSTIMSYKVDQNRKHTMSHSVQLESSLTKPRLNSLPVRCITLHILSQSITCRYADWAYPQCWGIPPRLYICWSVEALNANCRQACGQV